MPARSVSAMTYSATSRDRYRLAVSAVTGVSLVGALTAAGWLAGLASRDHAKEVASTQAAAEQRSRAAAAAAAKAERARARYDAALARRAQRPHVVLRHRPVQTRVTTRYVHATTGSTPIGGGGSVTAPSVPAPAAAAPPAAPAPAPAPAAAPPPPPPPPPPAPAPAPSTGSGGGG